MAWDKWNEEHKGSEKNQYIKKKAADIAFKPLKWEHYEKLDAKAKEAYNKQEREYNFNKKMQKKYGSSVEKGANKLNKFFGE